MFIAEICCKKICEENHCLLNCDTITSSLLLKDGERKEG